MSDPEGMLVLFSAASPGAGLGLLLVLFIEGKAIEED